MRTDLVLDALRMALGTARARRRGRAGRTTPTAASQYTELDYTQTLDEQGVLASVGSVGDAYDNAMAESFVDSFKTELIADRVWRTRTQLELAIVEYIGWYNTTDCTRPSATSRPSSTSNTTGLRHSHRTPPRRGAPAGVTLRLALRARWRCTPATDRNLTRCLRKPHNPVSVKAGPAHLITATHNLVWRHSTALATA